MKPKDALAIIAAIDKTGKKLMDHELINLGSIKNMLRADRNTSKHQDEILNRTYARVTEIGRLGKWR